MFLPSAQAAAVASVTQQQLQLQNAAATAAHINSINTAAAAAQVRQLSQHYQISSKMMRCELLVFSLDLDLEHLSEL